MFTKIRCKQLNYQHGKARHASINMRMRQLHILAFLLMAVSITAQQEAIFSQFFYNKTLLNPGATGSNGRPCFTAFHRQQWVGLEGAPVTQSLSLNTPLFAERVGLGMSLMNDRIGFVNATFINLAYAYRVQFGKGKLGIGMQASYLHNRVNWEKARTITNATDPTAGAEDFTPIFNVGVGAHFETERFFAGVSVPYLLERGLSESDAGLVTDFSGTTPHLFVDAGLLLDITPTLKMRPAIATRLLKNAPPTLDAHLSFGFLEENRLWVGSTYRWSQSKISSYGDALAAIVQYQLSPRWKTGLAYDMTLSSLRQNNQGTFELMLEYCFIKPGAAVRNPRFF
jgi:type IX secretion system PorP/SprF family membrane protein